MSTKLFLDQTFLSNESICQQIITITCNPVHIYVHTYSIMCSYVSQFCLLLVFRFLSFVLYFTQCESTLVSPVSQCLLYYPHWLVFSPSVSACVCAVCSAQCVQGPEVELGMLGWESQQGHQPGIRVGKSLFRSKSLILKRNCA